MFSRTRGDVATAPGRRSIANPSAPVRAQTLPLYGRMKTPAIPSPNVRSIHSPKFSGGAWTGRGRRRRVEAVKTGSPLRLRQTVKIELERMGTKRPRNPHPRLAIVIEPSIGPQQVVHQLVEHLVVAELHVPAEIPRETVFVDN